MARRCEVWHRNTTLLLPSPICPARCEDQKCDEFLHAVFCSEVGLFLIKASAFEHGKEDFDALSLFVGLEWVIARFVDPGNHPIFFAYR